VASGEWPEAEDGRKKPEYRRQERGDRRRKREDGRRKSGAPQFCHNVAGWESQGWSATQPLVGCPSVQPKPQGGGLSE